MRVAATYQKELFAIVEAVYKWHQYLIRRQFKIQTDHKSIKELMQQVVQTPIQQKYVQKLMGFDFVVEYKPRVANQVTNALSRMYEDGELVKADFMAISQPIVGLLGNFKSENETLEELRSLHQQLDTGSGPDGFRREEGLLSFCNRYYVGTKSKLKALLLREFHDTPSAGYGGVKKMLVGFSVLFYWRGMRKSVEDYIKQCTVCQQTKYSTQAVGHYLQPLPTPEGLWEDESMDFITRLPLSKGFIAVLVVVDRFSKYAIFGALPTNFNGHKVADLFLEIVVKHLVDELLREQNKVTWQLKQNLVAAKLRMEEKANRKRRDAEFKVRISRKGQKKRQNRTKPSTGLERVRENEFKGALGFTWASP
ncbi:ty3-gypsy retrotransposon protein [Tanacetum coccineum]